MKQFVGLQKSKQLPRLLQSTAWLIVESWLPNMIFQWAISAPFFAELADKAYREHLIVIKVFPLPVRTMGPRWWPKRNVRNPGKPGLRPSILGWVPGRVKKIEKSKRKIEKKLKKNWEKSSTCYVVRIFKLKKYLRHHIPFRIFPDPALHFNLTLHLTLHLTLPWKENWKENWKKCEKKVERKLKKSSPISDLTTDLSTDRTTELYYIVLYCIILLYNCCTRGTSWGWQPPPFPWLCI